ncbi:uncharacterized protein LOC108100171 [Drosophila ficusphila]|uniref:uncharacterized protein LOC108100171 n=1 Tax=Drosophila ficusphila TaxID=30025 RepID=UPI0007E81B2F|nr:uncharacterized protein LOC108100171 [Drosophila ficusphila]
MDESVNQTIFDASTYRSGRSTPLPASGHSLHMELIHYATASCRMFYIQDASAWQEWTTELESFEDLSVSEVCHIFLTDVLPRLDTFKLPERIAKRFKLLDIHPFFRRVSEGYQYSPDCELAARFVLQRHKDYRLTDDIELTRTPDSQEISQTLLVDNKEVEQKTCVGYKSKISPESAVLFSILVSTDLELSIGQIHDLGEIHSRLRRAKQSFEDTARLTPYRKDVDDLISNANVFVKLKSKLCRAISDCKKY